MKAVSAPPSKSKEYLPPPEDSGTGWEAGLINVERRINHALTVSWSLFESFTASLMPEGRIEGEQD